MLNFYLLYFYYSLSFHCLKLLYYPRFLTRTFFLSLHFFEKLIINLLIIITKASWAKKEKFYGRRIVGCPWTANSKHYVILNQYYRHLTLNVSYFLWTWTSSRSMSHQRLENWRYLFVEILPQSFYLFFLAIQLSCINF